VMLQHQLQEQQLKQQQQQQKQQQHPQRQQELQELPKDGQVEGAPLPVAAAAQPSPSRRNISEIEECTGEEEDGAMYGSGALASTLSASMPRTGSNNALSSLSQSMNAR